MARIETVKVRDDDGNEHIINKCDLGKDEEVGSIDTSELEVKIKELEGKLSVSEGKVTKLVADNKKLSQAAK